MSKLTPAEVALILERIRPSFPADTERLSAHVDTLGNEDALIELVREMVEATTASRASEDKTVHILATFQPIVEGSRMALEKLAKEEERRNSIEERKMKLAEDANQLWYTKFVAPMVTAIAGAIAAWSFAQWGVSP